MTTIGMQYDVIPGKEKEFEEGFINTLGALKSVAGHVESHLYDNVSNRGSYLILSRWETQQDFQSFLKSDAFKQVTAWGKAEILRARPKHRVYRDE